MGRFYREEDSTKFCQRKKNKKQKLAQIFRYTWAEENNGVDVEKLFLQNSWPHVLITIVLLIFVLGIAQGNEKSLNPELPEKLIFLTP